MVVFVVLLTAFHKVVREGDRAGTVQAIVDLPGGVAFLCVAQLGSKKFRTDLAPYRLEPCPSDSDLVVVMLPRSAAQRGPHGDVHPSVCQH